MLNSPTIEKLKDLKLKVMADMLADPDMSLTDLSFEERLGLMVDKEWMSRRNGKVKRLLHAAHLRLDACLEDVYYSSDRNMDKKIVQTLSTCTYIEQKLNVIITGKTGSGKSFLACALGNSACRHSYNVKYYRIPELLLELEEAKLEHGFIKFMSQLRKIDLLILDDLGLKIYTLEESRDILEIIESRYNKASTILSGQVAHTAWYELFVDPTHSDAFMDRVTYSSYIIPLDSKKSMREVTAKKLSTD